LKISVNKCTSLEILFFNIKHMNLKCTLLNAMSGSCQWRA
jgi:hypothetical protein